MILHTKQTGVGGGGGGGGGMKMNWPTGAMSLQAILDRTGTTQETLPYAVRRGG
jgi:hypothetical protein